MSRCGLLVGGLALSFAQVGAVRQRVDTSAVNAVETIGALLQERNLGTEETLHQLYSSAALTPGSEGSYVKSLKAVSQNITTQVEKKITDGQAATQVKLDSLFKNLDDANTAASTAKNAAVEGVKSWFYCIVKELAYKVAMELTQKNLAKAQEKEAEACQIQQSNKDFAFDAEGKYKLDYACDFMVDGQCTAAIGSWNQGSIQKMSTDARTSLAKDKEKYSGLKATCDENTKVREEALSLRDKAQTAWANKRAECKNLAARRQAAMCAYGKKAHAKCIAEQDYTKLVAATQKVQGDADSEVDRETEWKASRTTQCMITKSMQKGLNGALAVGDLDTCSGEVNFGKDVGKLNIRQAEFDALSKTNWCADGPITFFKSWWMVPAGLLPNAKQYHETIFKPSLDPLTSNNFPFCEAPPAEAPAV